MPLSPTIAWPYSGIYANVATLEAGKVNMGLFSKKKEPSGSKGKPGRGYEKGSATSNPDKYKARTEAQEKREDKKLKKWKG